MKGKNCVTPQESQFGGSVFLQNLHYFFAQTDGSYKWPAGSVGDLLKQAKREIEQQPTCDRDGGIDAAIKFIEKKRDDYHFEHGCQESDTGAWNYPGNGEDFMNEWDELIEELRALKAQQPAQSKSEAALAALVDQAQELDMGYGKPAQAEQAGLTDAELREIEKRIGVQRTRTSDEEYITFYPGEYFEFVKEVERATIAAHVAKGRK